MSNNTSAVGYSRHDVDRIALTVVEQIQQRIQEYESDAVSDINEHDLEQVELHIQAKRVENILDSSLKKIECALLLPWILECDAQTEENGILRDKWNDIHDRIEKAGEQSNVNEVYPDLYNCIETACRNLPPESLDEYREMLTDDGAIVLALLRELKYFAENKILMSAAKEMAKQKVLHRMWINNDNTVREIKRICGEIEAEESKFNAIIAEKRKELQLFQQSKEILLAKNSKELNELIIKSNRIMHEICQRRKIEQKTAEKIIWESGEKLRRMMESDLAEEKDMMEKKNDLERQLKEFIAKYDHEIGARNDHLHECNQTLQQDRETLADWKSKYEAQEIIYNKILADKEIEETREREEKLLLFMMNRSAVIIQRAYRKILSKRKGKKKKGRKGKK